MVESSIAKSNITDWLAERMSTPNTPHVLCVQFYFSRDSESRKRKKTKFQTTRRSPMTDRWKQTQPAT